MKSRLNPITSVLGAELYAIERAIEWVKSTGSVGEYLILTDSKSSLQLINKREPKTHKECITRIQKLLINLRQKEIRIILQWVPGHSGIKGNELVDKLAKQA